MQRNPQKRWSRSDNLTNEPPWSQKKKIMCWSYETWWWWHMLINYNEHTKGLVFSKYQLFASSIWYSYKSTIDSIILFDFLSFHHGIVFWNEIICLHHSFHLKLISLFPSTEKCQNKARNIKWHELFQCLTQDKRFKKMCIIWWH